MRDTEGAAKQNPHVACDVEGLETWHGRDASA